jgi:hypothetical protein
MTKKIISLLIAMSLVLGSLPVFASSMDGNKIKFTRDTVITESNFNDVLTSVGLDPTTGVRGKGGIVGVTTVGQLKDELVKAKKMPKEIRINKTVDNNGTITTIDKNGTTTITPLFTTTTGSTYLADGWEFTSVTTITHSVWADYSKSSSSKVWTGVNSANVSVSNRNGPLVTSGYDLETVSSLNSSYTSSMVTLDSDIIVVYYIIVLGVNFYPSEPQHITSHVEFSTSWIP